jgi:hypothetical protein
VSAITAAAPAPRAPLDLDASVLQLHVDLHCEIDAAAAELRAWIKRECSVLRRATSQRFRWLAHDLGVARP